MDKKILRKHMIRQRSEMTDYEVKRCSDIIYDKVLSLTQYMNSRRILIYCSYNNEVDTTGLIGEAIKAGKEVYLPRIMDVRAGHMKFYRIFSMNELIKSSMGILEPEVNNALEYGYEDESDIIICPGVAFDRDNNRLGYGGGFYDRFLEKNHIYSIALAYSWQVVDRLEDLESTDKRMDIVITS